jgi:6,7-dimethyl-8-ribityllumazine synthase
MAEIQGRLRAVGRLAIVVSRYNEMVTTRLLEGAKAVCEEAAIRPDYVDVIWVPGAFELSSVASALASSGRYSCLVALAAVVRGETPHFDFVAGEAARGLNAIAVRHGLPIGFGVLTVDTMDQALDRAGGAAGNKGREAAEAAILAADALAQARSGHV